MTFKQIIDEQKEKLDFQTKLYNQAMSYLRNAGLTNLDNLSDMFIEDLTPLMHLLVSSKRPKEVAENIKNLPSSRQIRDIFIKSQELFMDVQGIDINRASFEQILSEDIFNRGSIIDKKEEERISTMTDNLIKLRSQREGIIFVCGAFHADNLMAKFQEKNVDNVIYYFVHSSKRNFKGGDELQILSTLQKTLTGRMHLLRSESEINEYAKKIMGDIKAKNSRYQREIIEGTTVSLALSKQFGVKFQAFRRPGYYVDALLNLGLPESGKIVEKLRQDKIHTSQTTIEGVDYLVIPEINTEAVRSVLGIC